MRVADLALVIDLEVMEPNLQREAEYRVAHPVQSRRSGHIIPNHVCPAMNEHDVTYGFAAEWVEEIWRVEGRGKLH